MSSQISTLRLRTLLRKALQLACLLSGPALLSACANTPVATVEPFKTALRDVCISRDDQISEKTAQEIEANNLALRKLVGRKSECPKPSGKKPSPATDEYKAPSDPKTS